MEFKLPKNFSFDFDVAKGSSSLSQDKDGTVGVKSSFSSPLFKYEVATSSVFKTVDIKA